MADMTNEQAAEVLTERADAWAGTLKHFISGEEPTRRNVEEYTTVLRMAAAALRGPQPDPETGLVNCGCGSPGRFVVFKDDVGEHFYAACSGDCPAVTGDDTKEGVRKTWNKMMGYKEDA